MRDALKLAHLRLRAAMRLKAPFLLMAGCIAVLLIPRLLNVPSGTHFSYGADALESQRSLLTGQLANGTYATAPKELLELTEEELWHLNNALSAKENGNERLMLSELAERDKALGKQGQSGYLSTNDQGASFFASALFNERLSKLDDSAIDESCKELPAWSYLTLLLSTYPEAIWLSAPLVAFASITSGHRRTILDRCPLSSLQRRAASLLAALVLSLGILYLAWTTTFLISTLVSGMGTPDYPVVFTRDGDVVSTSAAAFIFQAACLQALYSLALLSLGHSVLYIFHSRGAAIISMGLLAFPCFLPGYYDTLTPWYPLLPYLPMSAFDLQPIIGRLSFFLTADVAKVSGIGPASCSIMMLAVILGSELLFFLLERAGTGRRWQRILQNGASVGNPPKEAALAVNDLSMRVGKHELLENASLELRAREVTGLIAPNGFGKTTLLNALWGNPVIHYTCSSFLIDGLPCQDDERTRKKMFLLPSDGRFFLDHQTGRYHLEATLGLWHSDGSLQQVIKDLCLEPFIDKRMARLSAGQRQLIGIATACLSEADILLLDEPMNALDPTNVRSASKAIEASSNRGSAVLLSSHILENLEELCGAFIFMSQRRLLMDEKGGDSASIKERYQQLYER